METEKKKGRGHCCLQVESLRILLAVDTPFREGLEEELERRSDLGFSAPVSVPFTQTGLATVRLRSGTHSSSSSGPTCPVEGQTKQSQISNLNQHFLHLY